MDFATRLRVLGKVVTGYRATPAARAALAQARQEHSAWLFAPDSAPAAGLMLFPGARVDLPAYAPLARDLAKAGVLVALVPVPAGLALLGQGPAPKILDTHPEVPSWAAAGHSLGATGAARIVHRNPDRFQALVMLAGYSAPGDDLSGWSGRCLCLKAENDVILNPGRYEAGKARLPARTTEVVVPGNHAGFGNYGPQVADGPPAADPLVQWRATHDAIRDFLLSPA